MRLFWGILGVLVLVNVQNDARRKRTKACHPGSLPPRLCLLRAVKTAGTFATIALLWSLWGSPSIADWFDMLQRGFGMR